MKIVKLLTVLVFLTNCASEIMRGFVGRDITEVMLSYGPPAAQFDLPDGRTAFQWSRSETFVTPQTTNYNAYASGNLITGSSTSYGGVPISYDCVYTLFAQPNSNNSYTVVGYKEPSLDCI